MGHWKPLSISGLLAIFVSGCVLSPRDAKVEQKRVDAAGAVYATAAPDRVLPELSEQPTWRDVLQRAFLANGELEVAYHDWAAAVAKIDQAGAYPNTPLSVGFETMFDGSNMNAWDRTTVTVGPDAMENLAFPTKISKAARIATDQAQAAGERFRAAKFALQKDVLTRWADYALLAERVRVQRENLTLLKLISDTAVNRVQAGASQQELLRAEIEHGIAGNELASDETELPRMRAMLNATLGRAPEAPLAAPTTMPSPRPMPADDQHLLVMAGENNPELAALARDVAGRKNALELARMQYIPDFNPVGGFTGSISQFLGVGISLPTVIPEIQGMIREARAELRGAEAMFRQTRLDRSAAVVAAILTIRNSERQVRLFEDQILPASNSIVGIARHSYTSGRGTFDEFITAQRTFLDVRLTLAEARAAREKGIAELEALIGADIETLAAPTTTPTSTTAAPTTAATTTTTSATTRAATQTETHHEH